MTPLTRCDLRDCSQVLLRPLSLLRVIVLLSLCTSLALARVHLQFLTQDLRIETHKLQRLQAELADRRQALVSEVEQKRYETFLSQYAEKELGLQKCPPECSYKAAVPAEVVALWGGLAREAAQSGRPDQRPKQNVLAAVGERMISLSRVALAREPGQPSE